MAAVSPHVPLGVHHSTVVSRRLSDVPSPLSSFLRSFRRHGPRPITSRRPSAILVSRSHLFSLSNTVLQARQVLTSVPIGRDCPLNGAATLRNRWGRLPQGERRSARRPSPAGSDREGASSLNGYVTAGRTAKRGVVGRAGGDQERQGHRHEPEKFHGSGVPGDANGVAIAPVAAPTPAPTGPAMAKPATPPTAPPETAFWVQVQPATAAARATTKSVLIMRISP